MMRLFHELRRHEEGQALVLAAICMLILTLCVLATVNLAYAADQKIRLQNASDAAAYNTAAYQARALNFLAYTNRAQVVHYASQMNLQAMLSYMIFALGVYTVLFNLLSLIPGLQFLQAILRVLQFIVRLLDIAVANIVLAIDGVNYLGSVAQFAVASSMITRVATLPDEELAAADRQGRFRAAQPLQGIFSALTAAKWAPGIGIVNALPVPSLSTSNNFDDKLNRAIMTEIANSARHEWTAYGSRNGGGWTIAGIPRHAAFGLSFGIGSFRIGKTARTEWGAYQRSGGGIISNLQNPQEVIYSLDRFEMSFRVFGFGVKFTVDAKAWADRKVSNPAFGGHSFGPNIQPQCPGWVPRRICERALRPLTDPLQRGVNAALAGMMQLPRYVPLLNHFHFGQLPYAKFKPDTSGSNLFNQPPVMVIANMPSQRFVQGGQPFMGRFGARIGNMTAGGSTPDRAYNAERNTDRSKRGFVSATDFRPSNVGAIPGFTDGLYAVSAALTYYHRPGDWREPPNLFNPFWGAKLMPITDHPQLGRLGLVSGAIGQLVVH